MKAAEPRQNRIPFMMSDAELEAIDEWRFANKIGTRAEAIRRLCQIGLLADAKADKLESSGQSVTDALFEWLKTTEDPNFNRQAFNERIPDIMSDQLELAVEIFTLSKPVKALRSTGNLEDAARSTAEISRAMEEMLRELEEEHQALREEYLAAKEGKA